MNRWSQVSLKCKFKLTCNLKTAAQCEKVGGKMVSWCQEGSASENLHIHTSTNNFSRCTAGSRAGVSVGEALAGKKRETTDVTQKKVDEVFHKSGEGWDPIIFTARAWREQWAQQSSLKYASIPDATVVYRGTHSYLTLFVRIMWRMKNACGFTLC